MNASRRRVQQITDKLDINLINIDGKTARGSYDREKKLKALHTVSAWATQHKLSHNKGYED